MSDKRTSMQCAARGCEGCVVCDTDNHGGKAALIEYRRFEEAIDNYWDQNRKNLESAGGDL